MERIIVEKVSKKFKIGFKKKQSALSRILSLFSGREPKKPLEALKDVSFKLDSGEIVGIIGKNGSGKSTLLRCIAGIYDYNGRIITDGRILPIIDPSIILRKRLIMRDNIYLVSSLLGSTRKQIKKRFNSIIDFAELRDFVDTKVYQFSDGMRARLAFSMAIHCNPEILLLDEVFEVGDESFRVRSAEKIKELVKKGASVILVSHDLAVIEKYCNKVIWMHEGKIVKTGKPDEVIKDYLNFKDR